VNVDGPGMRPAKICLWSMVSALLRGDDPAAVVLALDAPDPAVAAVAAETVAEVLRMRAVDTKSSPRELQESVSRMLAALAAEAGPDPAVSDQLSYVAMPEE
jgi:hypothetical protein